MKLPIPRSVLAEVHDGWLYLTHREDKGEDNSKGKYLFFSEDPFPLVTFSAELLDVIPSVKTTKICCEPTGDEYVLCVFIDEDESVSQEFASMKDKDIRFAGWKSNEDTRNGVYSEKFKQGLAKNSKKV